VHWQDVTADQLLYLVVDVGQDGIEEQAVVDARKVRPSWIGRSSVSAVNVRR
jgi:hypothetical protein